MKANIREGRAFSLVEVVVATGILAAGLVAVLALTGLTTRSAEVVADRAVAARLDADIRSEMERLKAELGLAGLAAIVPPAGSTAALELVATRDGWHLLAANGAAPAADHALNDPVQPGIAHRDRYFLAEVTQQLDRPYGGREGFLALTVRVGWPYKLPVGPATSGATAVDADAAREVSPPERTVVFFNVVVRP